MMGDIFSAPACFDLPAHPLAGLFPMLPDEEIAELADDICTFGQRVPIMVLDGQVLDGRNRLAACRIADIEPAFELYEGDDPFAFVLSHNLHRRHLTASQRAMVAAAMSICLTSQPANTSPLGLVSEGRGTTCRVSSPRGLGLSSSYAVMGVACRYL